MLNPWFWLAAFLVLVILFGVMHICEYKKSLSSENCQRGFISFFKGFGGSKYFYSWSKEILVILLGCIITFVPSQVIKTNEIKNEIIKTLNSCLQDIDHEYNLNLNFIYETGNPVFKEDIKNGEDWLVSDLLKKDVIINNISEDIRGYIYDEGQNIRTNYNCLQKEQDENNMREWAKKINSSYDNIIYLLDLMIDYQTGKISQSEIAKQYVEYLSSPKQDTTADAIVDVGYRLILKVRLDGDEDKSWKTSVNAQVGDVVEFLAEYRNMSDNTHTNVMIKNIPPKNFEIISGSTILYNTNHPDGAVLNKDAVPSQPFNIGAYMPASNAYISFKAKVVNVSLQPGSNTLVNWTQCGVGDITIQDYACVVLHYEGEVS